MQILSISGENIASLAEPFDLRLNAAPLSTAGLFAITGETGAGKSSLLDAMCLALYGDCPRLSGDGTRESIDDIDGSTIKSNDARMALRRGAVKGFAEVSFLAKDGAIYTAGWLARRARDKIDGRLQSIERSLVRASDGQILETQTSRVNEAVTALTGLTYDEFRRTVLLAQGDFDAFLGAKTDQRAAILEKVTGTGIYRDISRRVFERHKAAATALATLETRRGEHRLLTEEERAEVQDAIGALREKQTADGQALAAVQADLARHKALDEAQDHLRLAVERVERSKAMLEGLGTDRRWLASWDAAQGLRSEVREQQGASRALAEVKAHQAAQIESHAASKAKLAAAEASHMKARAALTKAEAAFKSFATDWDDAARLDSQIASAVSEHQASAAALAACQNRQGDCQKSHDDVVRQKAEQSDVIGALQEQLEATPGHQVLLSQWGLIEERLEARIDQAEGADRSDQERAGLAASIASDQDRRAQLDASIQSQQRKIAAAQQTQAEIKEQRSALQAADPSSQLDRLSRAQTDVTTLQQAGAAVRKSDAELADCQLRQAKAKVALAEQQAALTAAKTMGQEAAQVIEALRQPAEAADAAASQEAAHLRQHLVDGAACPVCQSTDHPIMRNDQIAQLAADLRSRLAKAQAARDRALDEGNRAEAAHAAASAVIDAEARRAPELAAEIARGIARFDTALKPLRSSPAASGLPQDPCAPDDAFEGLLATLVDRRKAAEKDRDHLDRLNLTHQSAVSAQEAGAAAIAQAETERREIDRRISAAEASIATLGQTIKAAEAAIASIDMRLSKALAPTGTSAADYGLGGGERLAQLRRQVAGLADVQARIDEGTGRLAKLDEMLAVARTTLDGAAANTETAQEVEGARSAALAALRSDRANLLGGEETGAHRSRHNDWRKGAQDAADASQTALDQAQSVFAGQVSAITAGQEAIGKAEQRHSEAVTALASACEAAGIDHDRVIALHATPEATVLACRAKLRAAETELANAEGASKDRADAFAALQAQGLPAIAKADLDTAREGLEAAIRTSSEVLGQYSQRLSSDAMAAKAIAGLESEIDSARTLTETWTAVNDAVGSAKGDRFAQIAQAVTLALLVERANLHLDDLKPRFQLRVASSDLALHVIDRDMAGDVRPTRLLSGGERFLVSLALALALSGMGNQGALAGTLFIDEGFGSLDADSLDLAIDALEQLQAQGRTVGVISHVQAMKDRIPVQVQVVKTGGGASKIELVLR